MAPSVSQGGQRLLGWGKMPGHGISEKRHFPSSYGPMGTSWAPVEFNSLGRHRLYSGAGPTSFAAPLAPGQIRSHQTDIRANLGKGLFGWAE